MDVLFFVSLLIVHIWVVLPATGDDPLWGAVFTVAAVAVAAFSVWRKGLPLDRVGLRLDNLLPALLIYLGVALLYAAAFLLWHWQSVGSWELGWPGARRTAWYVLWAFLQQFCLLGFLLNRLREILGREAAAVLLAAGIFAFFHLPNLFLVLYTLGGGLIMAWIFLRLPNLLAATLAHATASALIGSLLPETVTGWMRVGPLYWWATSP